MQLSKVALYGVLAQLASAAPFGHGHHEHAKREAEADADIVYVTKTIETTVIITAGATQALGDVYIPTTTSAPPAVETTPLASSTSSEEGADNVVKFTVFAGPDGKISTTSSSVPVAAATIAAETTSSTTPVAKTTSSTATPVAPVQTTTSSSTTAAASTTSASSDDSSLSSFQSEILGAHNAKRALHGVNSLSWDSTLASYAQNYANAYDCSGSLTHSGGPYGENLALGYSTTGAIDAWYSEGDNYDYGSSCSVYDHFTQVVWASTTKVGCGYKTCDSYWGTYIICSYNPAGNMVGECSQNVLPLV